MRPQVQMVTQARNQSPLRLARGLMPLLIAAWAGAVGAQPALRVPPEADITRLRPPSLPLPGVPDYELRIITPEKSPVPRAVDELSFEVNRVEVKGSTLFSSAELQSLFAPVLGKRVGLSALRDVAESIEERYRSRGYFLVRVFVPPQTVKEGVFTVQVIEGFIEGAFAQGATPSLRARAERVLSSVVGKRPIALAELEQALLTLNDLPGLSGGGVLRPGGTLGGSELLVDLLDPPKAQHIVNVNNLASKLIGPLGVSLTSSFTEPGELPGRLTAGVSSSFDSKLWALNGSYSLAVGRLGTVATLGALKARAQPAGAVRASDLVSDSESLSARLRHPWLRTREQSVFLEAGLAVNRSETTGQSVLLDEGRHTTFDVAVSWVGSLVPQGQSQLRVGLAQGVGLLGAFKAGDPRALLLPDFDPGFRKTTVSFAHTQGLTANLSAVFSLQVQRSDDVLVSGEQISFGGAGIGRGYDAGAIAGRQGFGSSLELRWLVDSPDLGSLGPTGKMQLFAFIDAAEVDPANPAEDASGSSRLGSDGIGARFGNSWGWTVDMTFARARSSLRTTPADPRGNPRFLISATRVF